MNYKIFTSIACLPSNMVFMSIFAPSRYESKLWDLKYSLRENIDDDRVKKLHDEIADISIRYSTCTTRRFMVFWIDPVAK